VGLRNRVLVGDACLCHLANTMDRSVRPLRCDLALLVSRLDCSQQLATRSVCTVAAVERCSGGGLTAGDEHVLS